MVGTMHPTWARSLVIWQNKKIGHLCFMSPKSEKDIVSSWWEVVTLKYFKYKRNTLNGSDKGMGMEDSVVLYHRIQEVKSKAVRPKTQVTYSTGEQ